MANWQRTLNLLPEWKQAENKEISVQEMAKVVSQRLAMVTPFDDYSIEEERRELIDEFTIISEINDGDDLIENFDSVMDQLYDWADQKVGNSESFFDRKKVCWVKTV